MAVVMGDVGRPSPLHGAAGGGGLAPVRRGRSNHAAAQSRLATHGARRYEQQAGCVGAPGREPAENAGSAGREPAENAGSGAGQCGPFSKRLRTAPQVSSAKQGRSAHGSHRIAKCNVKG